MDDQPFLFGNLETASMPKWSLIKVIGGHWFKQAPTFRNFTENTQLSESQKRDSVEVGPKDPQFDRFDGDAEYDRETLFLRAELAAGHMALMDLVGYKEIIGSFKDGEAPNLIFTTEGQERLVKPRTNHSTICLHTFIYVIGGIVDHLPTMSGLQLDVENGCCGNLASIGFSGSVSSPAVVGFCRHILVFDCYSEYQ